MRPSFPFLMLTYLLLMLIILDEYDAHFRIGKRSFRQLRLYRGRQNDDHGKRDRLSHEKKNVFFADHDTSTARHEEGSSLHLIDTHAVLYQDLKDAIALGNEYLKMKDANMLSDDQTAKEQRDTDRSEGKSQEVQRSLDYRLKGELNEFHKSRRESHRQSSKYDNGDLHFDDSSNKGNNAEGFRSSDHQSIRHHFYRDHHKKSMFNWKILQKCAQVARRCIKKEMPLHIRK